MPISGTPQVGALPPGVEAPKSAAERALYKQALEMESVFTQHLVDELMKTSASEEGEDGGGGGSGGIYKQMTNQVLNESLISGGGLGLAGALYAQMRETLGATTAPPATDAATGGADE